MIASFVKEVITCLSNTSIKEDGSFSGKIPQCPGVVAFGKTLYQCEQELRSSLEGWLIVKIRHGDTLPVVGRIALNKRMPTPKEAVAHG